MRICSQGPWLLVFALLIGSNVFSQSGQQPAPSPAADPADLLRSFRTLHIQSGTIYMRREVMQNALQDRPEFAAWQLSWAEKPEDADLVVEITLPFLTFEWNYKLLHRKSGVLLASGKVKAFVEKTAAPQLAAEIVTRIKSARPLPSGTEAAAVASAARPAPLPAKQWKAKLAGGLSNRIPKETALTVTVSRESVIGMSKQGAVFSVPVASVLAVTYHTQVRDPNQKWFDFWGQALSGDSEGGTAFFVLPIVLTGELILQPMKSLTHFVNIHWYEEGVIQGVDLQLSEPDCNALLEEFERVSGKKSRNLPEYARKVRKQLTEEYDKSPLLKIDRNAKVAWQDLPAREYKMIVLPQEQNLGDVYFLRADLNPGNTWSGEVQPEWVLAQAVVEIERKQQRVAEDFVPRVSFVERNGVVTISEIETNELILRFKAFPIEIAK